ncbi:MAG: maleate cis-trans isomerase family protein [Reyranella sp.]
MNLETRPIVPSSGVGRIRRIGVLLPPTNAACEAEFPRYVPEGCCVHFNRLSRLGTQLSSESLLGMIESVDRTARDLADLRPRVMLYACTTGTFLAGPSRHAEMGERIQRATGVPGITTATAVLEALHTLQAKRVFMVTPYPAAINEQEVEFLAYHGITVPRWDSFLHEDSLQNVRRTSAETADLVLRNRSRLDQADAVFISCTNLRSMDQIARLESELRVPVVSSNAATLWLGLRWIGASTAHLPLGQLYKLDPTWAICARNDVAPLSA